MQIHSVGIDLGKTTFHLVALGAAGKVLVKKKFTQKQLLAFAANMQTSLIGLKACSGAHFLGRALRQQGPRCSSDRAQFVKPFVKSNKNDSLTQRLSLRPSNARTCALSRSRQMTSSIFRRSIEFATG